MKVLHGSLPKSPPDDDNEDQCDSSEWCVLADHRLNVDVPCSFPVLLRFRAKRGGEVGHPCTRYEHDELTNKCDTHCPTNPLATATLPCFWS
jgi:hypothetical protein